MDSKEVYVISLDAVDLNLLPITRKTGRGAVMPLWSTSNLSQRNAEYYEFEIKTTDVYDNKVPVLENVVCHICDIEVPKVYLNEHKYSFKHKFNRKIADVALKRLQLYTNRLDDVDTRSSEVHSSTYYCLECSIVINGEDEFSHKKSIAHKNSMILERFLTDFLDFYANEDKHNDQQEIVSESKIEKDLLECKSQRVLVTTNRDRNKVEGIQTKEIKNEVAQNSNEAILKPKKRTYKKNLIASSDRNNDTLDVDVEKIENNSKTTTQSLGEILNLNEYLKLLNGKFDGTAMNINLAGDDVVIKTLDGSMVRVGRYNFLAFTTVGDNYLYCQICRCLVSKLSRDGHLLSEHHMKVMSLPLVNKHCLRKISDAVSHCLLCNITVTNTDLHVTSNTSHNDNLRKYITLDMEPYLHGNALIDKISGNSIELAVTNNNSLNENTVFPIKGNSTNIIEDNLNSQADYPKRKFCEVCNVKVGAKKLKNHESTTNHIINAMSDYHYLMNNSGNGKWQCIVCNVTIPNSVHDLTEHFKSIEHIEKYANILTNNYIILYEDGIYYCEKCLLYILHKNEFTHMLSEDHKTKTYLNNLSLISDDNKTDTVNDVINKEAVTEVIAPEVEIDETTGEAALSDKVTQRSINMDVVNCYYCDVCNVRVPKNVYNIATHLNGKSHKRKLDNIGSEENVANKEQLHYLMVEIETGVAKCLICNEDMEYIKATVEKHIKSEQHLKNYEEFFEENRLVYLDSNIHCVICAVPIGVKNEISHCVGDKHMRQLELAASSIKSVKS